MSAALLWNDMHITHNNDTALSFAHYTDMDMTMVTLPDVTGSSWV